MRPDVDSLLSLAETAGAERAQPGQKRGWYNKVDPLTLGYEDYRKTKLWKTIKARVLVRDRHQCQRCKGKATVVHHISYDQEVMSGCNDEKLISLCDGCHEVVHFTSAGERRCADDQLAALSDLDLNELVPKVDLRMDPFKRPVWKRLTSTQRSAYLAEHNAKKIRNRYERKQNT